MSRSSSAVMRAAKVSSEGVLFPLSWAPSVLPLPRVAASKRNAGVLLRRAYGFA
jgi:hypothetical protein